MHQRDNCFKFLVSPKRVMRLEKFIKQMNGYLKCNGEGDVWIKRDKKKHKDHVKIVPGFGFVVNSQLETRTRFIKQIESS